MAMTSHVSRVQHPDAENRIFVGGIPYYLTGTSAPVFVCALPLSLSSAPHEKLMELGSG